MGADSGSRYRPRSGNRIRLASMYEGAAFMGSNTKASRLVSETARLLGHRRAGSSGGPT